VLHLDGKTAFTTDSYVVTPLFFRGGDIGRLSVCGTVNDLLMMGAVPEYISAGFIIEEGMDLCALEDIVISMSQTAEEAGVTVVTGDTKVIEGKGGLYIKMQHSGIFHPSESGIVEVL
jgi:hydrogenase expression/formation protein HypE